MTFETFIDSLGLRHFSPAEFLVGRGADDWSMPHEQLWPNLATTAVVIDEIRAEVGEGPWRITSCWRPEAYNRREGGGELSNHQALTATDVQAIAGFDAAFYADVGAMVRSWRGERFDVASLGSRVQVRVGTQEKSIPFAALPVWDRRAGSGSLVEFHGGVGVYSSFLHVDSRGLDHSWDGGA